MSEFITPKIPDKLFEIDLKQFLDQFSTQNIHSFLLNNKRFSKEESIFLSDQLKIYRKVKTKLPTFAKNYCWFTSKSFEQCSSEACALYKKNYWKGNSLLDLSGGLGVDDYAFCQSFSEVISVDPDENLNQLVEHNFKKLDIKNHQRITATAQQFLETNTRHFDLIYIDADRRSGKQKSVLFKDANPNIVEIIPLCFKFSDTILIKLSPLVDLTYCKNNLVKLKEITILEYQNEVKEILCLLCNKPSEEMKIKVAFINQLGVSEDFEIKPLNKVPINQLPQKENYIYEPPAAIRKADACMEYANFYGLNLINEKGTFLTSNKLINEFKGRVSTIKDVNTFNDKDFKHYLKINQIKSANIVSRQFVMKAEEIQKRYKLLYHDKLFIYITTYQNKKIFIVGERIQ